MTVTDAPSFADVPSEYRHPDKAGVVVVPVPYDRTSTWIKGADQGPRALIEASANLELYDMETDSQVFLNGIFTDAPVSEDRGPEDMVAAVRQRVETHLANQKFTVVVGGEHSVSIGAVQAHARAYPGMTVLQLDAHADLRDEYEGSKYNHACVMARVKELCPVVQVGIRSMDVSEKPSIEEDRVFRAEEIHGSTSRIGQVVSRLSKQVYITIDLDVFDPAIMPSTGTPEPGGLLWYDVLALLKTVTRRTTVVGFDVVELCPTETNRAPDFLAAKLVYKLLSYKFRG